MVLLPCLHYCGSPRYVRLSIKVHEDSPPEPKSAGLRLGRQWYLYREIRQFVEEGYKDLVAPLPEQQEMPERSVDEAVCEPVAKVPKVSSASEVGEVRKGKGKGRGKKECLN
ncbi:hypothetical protein ElyMa_003328500 [Elysia marginata]|uniref:Uncharacterized protein n=1 Tax=Elysia marginata TaxID=1093978 RepID=A0AAV4JHU0_9GAST|nr:hypothetical protein ElyMa_003328500 [Elysia marginata]